MMQGDFIIDKFPFFTIIRHVISYCHNKMKKNEILENIRIDKLIFGGKGLAIAPDGRKIIVT